MKPPITFRTITDIACRIASRCARVTRPIKPTKPASDPPAHSSTKTVKIEWGLDFDKTTVTTESSFLEGVPRKSAVKGRCAECWGSLVGRLNDDHQVTGIKCRVCAKKLEGDAARDEHTRMQEEHASNMFKIQFARLPRYADDATFVQKIIPRHDPIPKEQVEARAKNAKGKPKNKRLLTRHDFPLGSPGYFVLQAVVLMASVEGVSHPDEWSVADFPDVRFRDDGAAVFTLSTGDISQDPQYQERQLIRRMGQTITAAMISAFACELAMKAIALTAKDEALKTHDLHDLYKDLPDPSRLRIAADYGNIETLFNTARQTFGAWRYFETGIAKTVTQAMIDTEQARSLGKAARVVLDEAEVMGLEFSVDFDAKERISVLGDTRTHRQTMNVNIEGREGPPGHDPVLP